MQAPTTGRRHFLVGTAAAFLSGCAGHSSALLPVGSRRPSCNVYLSHGRETEATRAKECGSVGVAKGDDSATPMSAAQQQILDVYNVTADANGNPIVQRLNAAGGYTAFPLTGGIALYNVNSVDAGTASTILNSFQTFLNNIDYSGADADDAQLLSAHISAANGAIQTAYSTLAPADLVAAADAVGRVRNDLPEIGRTHSKSTPTYTILDWWNVFHPQYADRDAMQKPPRNTSCTNQKATMRRIASAAIAMNGMNTANKPGAGSNACAWAVNNALQMATGDTYVGGTGNPNWVPDVSKGLIAAGFTVVTGPQNLRPGDIAVQNGWGDGGPSGSTQNPYENHIGIVVQNPQDGNLAIMNNSSSNQSFTNFDESLSFAGYYTGAQDGLPKFYRVPSAGLPNQSICQGP